MYSKLHRANRLTFTVGPAFVPALLTVSISVILVLSQALAAGTPQEPVRVENGFDGSLSNPPTLIEQVRIEDPPTGEALLYHPNNFLFSEDGDVYIPDEQAYTVFHFDTDGHLIRRIGREGNGPGEFQCPSEVHINWDGELIVVDPGTQRINYFSTDGEFLRSENIQVTRGTRSVTIRILDADRERIPTTEGNYIHKWMFETGPSTREFIKNRVLPGVWLLEIIDSRGKSVLRFGDITPHEDAWTEFLLNRMWWDYRDGRVAVAYRYRNDIHLYRLPDPQPYLIMSRRTAFRPNSNPRMEERIEFESAQGGKDIRMITIADAISIDVAFDPSGRIWVITSLLSQKETEERMETGDFTDMVRLEVFSPEGELLAGIPLSEPATRLAFDPFGHLWLLDNEYTLSARRYEVR